VTRDANGEKVTCIFIIGGWLGVGPLAANDVHMLDISSPKKGIRWVPVRDMKGASPGPCNMHSSDFVSQRNEIYVFRGGNGREYLNDLHAFDVNTFTWRLVESKGEIPNQRANHSSAFLEETNELFIFGGWNGKERLNDIHILDIVTCTWSSPHIGGVLPHPRAGMTLTAIRGRLYLFGGSGTSSKCFMDLHVLDRKDMTWLDVMHTESSSIDNNIYLQSESQLSENDATRGTSGEKKSKLSLAEWEECETISEGDSVLKNAANPNETEYAPAILICGKGPGRRAGHTATAVHRFVYVFGGSCGSDYLNDFFVLDTDPPKLPCASEPTSVQLLATRLNFFCNREEFADVVFLVEGKPIYAHKIILSLVSNCYRAMFSTDFRERGDCPEIEIPNCSYEAFLTMMEYIYSGIEPKIEISLDGGYPNSSTIEVVVNLLELADQYFLDNLKQLCERKLQPVVNAETIDCLLQVSQKTNSVQLESVCRHFQRNNNDE